MFLAAVAQNCQVDLGPRRGARDVIPQRVAVIHADPIDCEYDISRANTGALRGAAVIHRIDQDTADFGQAQALGQVGSDLLNAYAQPASPNLAAVPQLTHHISRHVGGNRKADPDVTARWRENLAVDADQLAASIDQR